MAYIKESDETGGSWIISDFLLLTWFVSGFFSALAFICKQAWYWAWLICLFIAKFSFPPSHDPVVYPLLTSASLLATILLSIHCCWPWLASCPWSCCLISADLSLLSGHDPAVYPLLILACLLAMILLSIHCWPRLDSWPQSCCLSIADLALPFGSNPVCIHCSIGDWPPQTLPPTCCGGLVPLPAACSRLLFVASSPGIPVVS